MARAQRVSFADRPDTYTVVGRDELPIDAAQEYLRFVSASGRLTKHSALVCTWFGRVVDRSRAHR